MFTYLSSASCIHPSVVGKSTDCHASGLGSTPVPSSSSSSSFFFFFFFLNNCSAAAIAEMCNQFFFFFFLFSMRIMC